MACPAAVAATLTGYLLIRPALTREVICGIQEHVHTDLCYTQTPEAQNPYAYPITIATIAESILLMAAAGGEGRMQMPMRIKS